MRVGDVQNRYYAFKTARGAHYRWYFESIVRSVESPDNNWASCVSDETTMTLHPVNLSVLAREMESIQEGLKALQRHVDKDGNVEAKFIVENLLSSVAAIIFRCKVQRNPVLRLPDSSSGQI